MADLKIKGSDETLLLYSAFVKGKEYMFLPSGASFSDNEYKGRTMQSSRIPSLHFFSADPEGKGISYIHADQSNKAEGDMYMCDQDFSLLYKGKVDALKGRGNSTWMNTDKKAYQIKLSKKADLLDPEKGTQKAKKWILLANAYDPTLIRNTLVYDFSRKFGITSTPECMPVDFYYDGEYRGSYLLCEKVEVGNGRVEIDDLQDELEKVNEGKDLDSLIEFTTMDEAGKRFKYEFGIRNPSDIRGAYLLEVDLAYYYMEKSWFEYAENEFVTCKSPEYMSGDMIEYMKGLFIEASDYISGQAENLRNGKKLDQYIDVDSFARYYIISELFDIQDAWISSTYLYKPADTDLIYAGPVWDCDSSMRLTFEDKLTEGWFRGRIGKRLLQLPEFRKAVKRIYKSELRDIIFNDLMGGETGKSYAESLKDEVKDSRAMNYKIWAINDNGGTFYPKATVKENYKEMFEWLDARVEWLDKAIMDKSFAENTVKISRVPGVRVKAAKGNSIIISFGKARYRINNIVRRKKDNINNYQISYRRSGTGKWKKRLFKGKTRYKIKGLKKGAVYEVRIRPVYIADGRTIYGEYSSTKKVRIK